MSDSSDQAQRVLQLQAIVNRLQARLGSGLADAAASLLAVAQDTPARLEQEWQLFWQEVELEAERLARGDSAVAHTGADSAPEADAGAGTGSTDPQQQIDALRARVAGLSQRLDGVAP
jgi:uncharacterized protein YceH (UPF0502 family)